LGFNCHNMFIYLLEWSGFPGMLQKKSCMFHICAYKIPSVKHMFHKFSHMFHTFFLIWKHMEHPWKTHEHMSGIYKNMFSLHRPYIGLIYGRYLQSIGSWVMAIEYLSRLQGTAEAPLLLAIHGAQDSDLGANLKKTWGCFLWL
jgi:hypothetical protein